jgi:hypothetical protein
VPSRSFVSKRHRKQGDGKVDIYCYKTSRARKKRVIANAPILATMQSFALTLLVAHLDDVVKISPIEKTSSQLGRGRRVRGAHMPRCTSPRECSENMRDQLQSTL